MLLQLTYDADCAADKWFWQASWRYWDNGTSSLATVICTWYNRGTNTLHNYVWYPYHVTAYTSVSRSSLQCKLTQDIPEAVPKVVRQSRSGPSGGGQRGERWGVPECVELNQTATAIGSNPRRLLHRAATPLNLPATPTYLPGSPLSASGAPSPPSRPHQTSPR